MPALDGRDQALGAAGHLGDINLANALGAPDGAE
jgi:hypothetical protein